MTVWRAQAPTPRNNVFSAEQLLALNSYSLKAYGPPLQ